MLELLGFRYYNLDDLLKIKNKIIKTEGDESRKKRIESIFEKMLTEEDWEKELPSINPDVDPHLGIDDVRETLFHSIKFRRIQKIVLHWIKVAQNPFGFSRVVIFECELMDKDPESSRGAIEDRFSVGLGDLDDVDKLFVSSFADLNPNLWLVVGNEAFLKGGLYEKPDQVQVKEHEASIEKYYSSESWYILYSKEPIVRFLELSDLAFLLTIPIKKPKLDNDAKKVDKERLDWQKRVNDLIVHSLNTIPTSQRRATVAEVTSEMAQYFRFNEELNKLHELALTLEGRVQRAQKAVQGQIHRIVAEDLESVVQESLTLIESIGGRLKDTFSSLKEVFGTSSANVQLDLLARSNDTIEALKKAGEGTRKLNVTLVVLTGALIVLTGLLLLRPPI